MQKYPYFFRKWLIDQANSYINQHICFIYQIASRNFRNTSSNFEKGKELNKTFGGTDGKKEFSTRFGCRSTSRKLKTLGYVINLSGFLRLILSAIHLNLHCHCSGKLRNNERDGEGEWKAIAFDGLFGKEHVYM